MPNRDFVLKVLKAGPLLGAVFLAAVTFPSASKMVFFFTRGSYYIMALLVVLWAAVLLKYAARSGTTLPAFLRANGAGILLALFLSCLIFVSVKPAFRVLADEANVVSVSKSMLYERMVDNVTEGKRYFLNFQPLQRVIEKRSLLFPFFANLVHLSSGYRVENVFATNFIVLVCFLSLLYVWFKPHVGAAWASIILVLVVSQPIVSLCATSGGQELIQALFLVASLMSLERFMERQTAEDFELLWINFLVFCHTRYESFVLFGLVLVLVARFGLVRKDFFGRSLIYAATPLLVLPIVWQRIIMRNHFQQPPGEAIFSVAYYVDNNLIFLKSLVDFKFFLPFANAVNLVGVAALVYFAYRIFWQGRLKTSSRLYFFVIVFSVMALAWVIFTSHFQGTMDIPSSARFFLMFSAALSVLAALFLREWLPANRVVLGVVAVGAVGAFCLYHPLAVENRFVNAQTVIREYQFVDEFLKNQKDRDFLLITSAPGFFTIRDTGSVYYPVGDEDAENILLEYKRRLFSNIFVYQEISYETQEPTPETRINGAFELEPLDERQNTADVYMRISKVVNKR